MGLCALLVSACCKDAGDDDVALDDDSGDDDASDDDSAAADPSTHLDIPPRLQWTHSNGYCGSCSVQSIGLFFGSYVSQDAVRNTIGDQEVLVAVNEDGVLDALRFEYERWDYNAPQPQYQDYLVWTKGHLHDRSPVILTVYVRGMHYEGYDHILPAIGFQSTDTGTYHEDDEITFNSLFDLDSFTRSFGSFWDTRAMDGNCSTYDYCIPRDVNYGVAVTGILDDHGETYPIHLSIGSASEPSVQAAVLFEGTLEITDLTAGADYVVLRYNDYEDVPAQGFLSSSYDASTPFTATGSVHTMTDSFMSDSVAIYRCVAAPSG